MSPLCRRYSLSLAPRGSLLSSSLSGRCQFRYSSLSCLIVHFFSMTFGCLNHFFCGSFCLCNSLSPSSSLACITHFLFSSTLTLFLLLFSFLRFLHFLPSISSDHSPKAEPLPSPLHPPHLSLHLLPSILCPLFSFVHPLKGINVQYKADLTTHRHTCARGNEATKTVNMSFQHHAVSRVGE